MLRAPSCIAALSLAAFQVPVSTSPASLQLSDARLSITSSPQTGDGGIIIESESELSIEELELRDPRGVPVFRLKGRAGLLFGLRGFKLEGEGDLSELLATYVSGSYEIRARTYDGRLVCGSAELSHELPAAPLITVTFNSSPTAPANECSVQWNAVPGAIAYEIRLESPDGDSLEARVPGHASEFTLPAQLLSAGQRYGVEVSAVNGFGNQSSSELLFFTR